MFFTTQATPYQHYHNGSPIRQRVTYRYSWPDFSPLLQKWIGISIIIAFTLTLTATLFLRWQISNTEQQVEMMQNVRLEKVTDNMALLATRAKLSSKETIQKLACVKFNLIPPTPDQLR